MPTMCDTQSTAVHFHLPTSPRTHCGRSAGAVVNLTSSWESVTCANCRKVMWAVLRWAKLEERTA